LAIMDIQNGATGVAQRGRSGQRPLVALLIAGEPAETEQYGRKLRLDGYTVATADSLERGLELATMARPDLIFVCLGSWAVPALVLLVLRSDQSTSGVPLVLVSDLSRAHLSSEVGGMMATEQVVTRGSGVHMSDDRTAGDRASGGRTGKRNHRPKNWDRWLPPQR